METSADTTDEPQNCSGMRLHLAERYPGTGSATWNAPNLDR